MPYLRQGQPKHDCGHGASRHFSHTLGRRGGQGVPLAKAHPRVSPPCSKGRARFSAGLRSRSRAQVMVGTVSSPAHISAHFQSFHPNKHPKPLVHHQARQGNESAHSEHRVHNPCHGGHDDREWHSLSYEGLGPKVFRSNVRDTHFPKCFRTSNNVVRYDGKTNPSVWLEDYHLTCRAGGADDDLFII
jgi:hypothetical protein